ncbi:MAG TPA: hypothetical protein VLJ58_03535 [Ramlibacter sp.]|nr:hypothetical protein [Ramlibacter sp.]
MTTPPSKPSSSKPGFLDEPYVPGDPIPVPVAEERNSATDWAAFTELSDQHDARFAPTAPASLTMRLSEEERHFAITVPAGLQAGPQEAAPPGADAAPAPAPTTLDQVMAEARRNNRVCPQPQLWEQLYDMLPGKIKRLGRIQPQPPLTGRAWAATPALAKRVALRDHIEWADAHARLDEVMAFFRQMSEEQWHHLGD